MQTLTSQTLLNLADLNLVGVSFADVNLAGVNLAGVNLSLDSAARMITIELCQNATPAKKRSAEPPKKLANSLPVSFYG